MSTAATPASSEPLSPVELDAWRGMLQVHAKVMRALDAQMQAEHGLSVSAYEVLMFLGDAPGRRLRMAEIADRVLLSRSGCTRLVDRLAQLGYVTRCAAETDGRGLYAQLTDAGAEKLAEARRTHLRGIREVFLERLTVTDQLALADVWRRWRQADEAGEAGEAGA
jgi:DNA-binding MarR family transcriptional regulator